MPTMFKIPPTHQTQPQKRSETMFRMSGIVVFTSPPAPGIIGPPGGGKPPGGP
jgi:hypothetical protein